MQANMKRKERSIFTRYLEKDELGDPIKRGGASTSKIMASEMRLTKKKKRWCKYIENNG